MALMSGVLETHPPPHDNQCRNKSPMAAVTITLAPVKKREQESFVPTKVCILLLFYCSASFPKEKRPQL